MNLAEMNKRVHGGSKGFFMMKQIQIMKWLVSMGINFANETLTNCTAILNTIDSRSKIRRTSD